MNDSGQKLEYRSSQDELKWPGAGDVIVGLLEAVGSLIFGLIGATLPLIMSGIAIMDSLSSAALFFLVAGAGVIGAFSISLACLSYDAARQRFSAKFQGFHN